MKVCTYIDFTGREVYFLRIALKLSQQALADQLACSKTLICLIETGERKITPEMSNNLVELVKQKGNYNKDTDRTEEEFINKLLSGTDKKT